MISRTLSTKSKLTFVGKIKSLPVFLIVLIWMLAGLGAMALFSAAGGEFDRWASNQFLRFVFLFFGMLIIAMIHIKYWYYLAYPMWVVGLSLLIVVEVMGHIGMGAQRWINLGFMNLQPSELMKIAVITSLARYYHDIGAERAQHYKSLIVPAIFMSVPMGLVMIQPDLGTALMIGMGGTIVMFLAGVRLRLFISGILLACAVVPPAYYYFLRDYQRARVDIFLDPSRDPTGAGYHVTQSKIAIGSGGIHGKGFLEGTQARLNFLPEKHTDFIFTLWTEENGLIGGILLIGLFISTFIIGFFYALQARHIFSRLLILGLTMNICLHVMVNTGMVMGVLPVVGIPLPMISYGGSAMMAALICYGLIICARVHRGEALPKSSDF